ncbi:MAG: UDP-3-O-acyl-N-acetylglucosamine deacetylase, partial [Holosporaceae bacterium]|nr:UDP-3-O-acyl-N-acetylglucosamine deacetylase [Holosporaceae bacterium]
MQQGTVKSEIVIKGIGIHGGVDCRVSILPAPVDSGIVYVILNDSDSGGIIRSCADNSGAGSAAIRASYLHVTATAMCTRLGRGKIGVSVVEHLSAALYICGVSNAIIRVCGGEIPILDGSAAMFVKKILEIGVHWQIKPRKKLKIIQPVKVEEEGKSVTFSPS